MLQLRWSIGTKDGVVEELFRDKQYKNTVIASNARPMILEQSEESNSGTMWITINTIPENYYIKWPEDPMITIKCVILALNGTIVWSSDSLHYSSSIDISIAGEY